MHLACCLTLCFSHARSITRDNLGPYKAKVIYIPSVFLVTTLVRIRFTITHLTSQFYPAQF